MIQYLKKRVVFEEDAYLEYTFTPKKVLGEDFMLI
jgi:hypothetical protein